MLDLEGFVKSYEASSLTKVAYRQSLMVFQKFLGKKEPSEENVEEFKQQLYQQGRSSATVCRHLSAIRAYFKWMKKKSPKEKRADYDLVVKGPKMIRKLPTYHTEDDVKAILAAAKTPFERSLVTILYDGALRIQEAMQLDVSDIDFIGGYITILRKGGVESRLPVSEATLKTLKKHIGSRKGKIFPEPYWKLRYMIRRLGNKAHIRNFNPHQFRHARACELRALGVAIEDIQEFLGHKNIETTLIYARMMPAGLKEKIPAPF